MNGYPVLHSRKAFLATALCCAGTLWAVGAELKALIGPDVTGPTGLHAISSIVALRPTPKSTKNVLEARPVAPVPVALMPGPPAGDSALPRSVAFFFRHGDMAFLQSMHSQDWTACGGPCMQALLAHVNAWQPLDPTALAGLATWAGKQSNGAAQVLTYAALARAEVLGQPLGPVSGVALSGGDAELDADSRSALLDLRGLPDWAWHQLQQRVAQSPAWRVTLAERLQSATDPEQANALLNFLPESDQWALLRDPALRQRSLTASSLDAILASNGAAEALEELLTAAQDRAPNWLLNLGQNWAGRQLSGTRLDQLDAALADPNLSAAQWRLARVLLRNAEDGETARAIAQRRGVSL